MALQRSSCCTKKNLLFSYVLTQEPVYTMSDRGRESGCEDESHPLASILHAPHTEKCHGAIMPGAMLIGRSKLQHQIQKLLQHSQPIALFTSPFGHPSAGSPLSCHIKRELLVFARTALHSLFPLYLHLSFSF